MALPTPTKTTRDDGLILWQYDWATQSVTVQAATKSAADTAMQARLDAIAAALVEAPICAANAATIKASLQSQIANALALADLLDTNNATPAQQRAALSLCLRGVVRLAKVVYSDYAQPA